jgi:hypothetical protein
MISFLFFFICCVATLPPDAEEEYWQEDLVAQPAEIRFNPLMRMKVAAVIGPDKLVGDGAD